MSKTNTAVLIIGLIMVGGIAYALAFGDSAMMKEDGAAMMEDKAVVQGDAVTGDSAKKDDTMMKDAAMKAQTPATGSEMMMEATGEAMMDSDGMKQVQ